MRINGFSYDTAFTLNGFNPDNASIGPVTNLGPVSVSMGTEGTLAYTMLRSLFPVSYGPFSGSGNATIDLPMSSFSNTASFRLLPPPSTDKAQ